MKGFVSAPDYRDIILSEAATERVAVSDFFKGLLMAQICPMPLMRTAEAPKSEELTPARHRLRRAIALLTTAQREAEAAAEPVARLTDVIGLHDRLRAELRSLYERDEAATGEWIAAGRTGVDPGDAVDTRLLNERIAAMQDELAAARRVLPAKEALHRVAVERVSAVAAERDAALYAVAAEAAENIAVEFTEALNRALMVQSRIESLRDTLQARGNAGDIGALASADKLRGTIQAAKAAAGVPRDVEAGSRLLDALAHDPTASLQ